MLLERGPGPGIGQLGGVAVEKLFQRILDVHIVVVAKLTNSERPQVVP